MSAYIPCLDSRLPIKIGESDRIAAETERFLKRGGKIEVIDSSVFGDPTLPACPVMRHRSQAVEKSKSLGLSKMHQAAARPRTKKNNSDIFGGEG